MAQRRDFMWNVPLGGILSTSLCMGVNVLGGIYF